MMAGASSNKTSSKRGEEGGLKASWRGWPLLGLIIGNAVLALGPWWVRLADTGPVSAGFWRMTLALPAIVTMAFINRQPLTGFSRNIWIAVLAAGLAFGLDLASWHIGIERTRLGNAVLFGNSGSLIVMAWGLLAGQRKAGLASWTAFLLAILGGALLMGRSLEIDHRTLSGDLFSLLAGFFYAFYILILQNARTKLGSWSLLSWSSLACAPLVLGFALLLDEPFWPQVWWPVIGLALSSQLIGQGLIVYAMRHFSPLMLGLSLMTQPVVAVVTGWISFDERLGLLDVLGMLAVGGALVLARADEKHGA